MTPRNPDTARAELRDRLRDRPVVLLSATEGEAGPVLAALSKVERFPVLTKTVYTGELGVEHPASLGGVRGVKVVLAVTGCDKANAAHGLTCLLENMSPAPRLVVQVGIAGGFATGPRAPEVGDIVVATQEAYADTGSSSPDGWLSAADLSLPVFSAEGTETGGRFLLDGGLVAAATAVLEALDWSSSDLRGREAATGGAEMPRAPAILAGPCVTSSRVTGLSVEAEALAARWGALAESMEGAAAAHVCALYGIPFLEIRGISNLVVDRDRASWQVERAAAMAGRAAVAVVAALGRLPA